MSNTSSATVPSSAMILEIVELLWRDPEIPEAQEWREWFVCHLQRETGLPTADLMEYGSRLLDGKRLDSSINGTVPGSIAEQYLLGGGVTRPRDLLHVQRALRELDRDGTTGRLWRVMCRKWPSPFEAGVRELRLMQAQERASATAPLPVSPVGEQIKRADRKGKGKDIEKRMRDMLADDASRDEWTIEQWAGVLGCQKSSVHGTKAWETIMRMRAMKAAERINREEHLRTDRRRLGKKKRPGHD